MAEALRLGINRHTLYAMRDAHVVEPVSRGVYRLASLDPLTHPDLVTVALRVPQGVLCLISALSFHELCVCDLSRVLGRSMPATSQQLQRLRREGVVKCRMQGKLAYYRLESPTLERAVCEAFARHQERSR